MGDSVLIKIKEAEKLKDSNKRILAWLALTDEFGKPSDKYIHSFMYNFGDWISHGDMTSYARSNRTKIAEATQENDFIEFTGGMLFFEYLSELKGKTKEEIEESIRNWSIDNAINMEEAGMGSIVTDTLKHPLLFELSGTSRGGWKAQARYNPATQKFTLLAGSTIAKESAYSCSDKSYRLLTQYQDSGKISPDPERKVLVNIEIGSASTLANFVELRSIGIHSYKVCGTHFTLEGILGNEILYNRAVEVQGLNKQNTAEDKEVKHNGDEDMAYEQIRPNDILSKNKHNLKVEIKTNIRGGCNAVAIYSYKYNQWALISGKICSTSSNSTGSWEVEAEELIKEALKDGRLTHDYEIDTSKGGLVFSCLGRLATFCRRSGTTWGGCYVFGTDTKVKDIFENKLKYQKYVVKNQKDWELV